MTEEKCGHVLRTNIGGGCIHQNCALPKDHAGEHNFQFDIGGLPEYIPLAELLTSPLTMNCRCGVEMTHRGEKDENGLYVYEHPGPCPESEQECA